MKRTLDEAQLMELRKLGYMKDDSLAGLIEFRLEHKSLSVDNMKLVHLIWNPKQDLIDWEYETVRGILVSKKVDIVELKAKQFVDDFNKARY